MLARVGGVLGYGAWGGKDSYPNLMSISAVNFSVTFTIGVSLNFWSVALKCGTSFCETMSKSADPFTVTCARRQLKMEFLPARATIYFIYCVNQFGICVLSIRRATILDKEPMFLVSGIKL